MVNHNPKLPREANKKGDDTMSRIYKFYHNNKKRIELTEKEEATREKIERAWLLLTGMKTSKYIADELSAIYGISKSGAFDLVKHAMIIFGDPRMQVKEGKRAIAEHQFLTGAEKALEKGELELHLRYMKAYAEINGLNNVDTAEGIADVMKKLRPTTIILNFRKEEVEREAERLHDQLASDIEFEEIDE